MSEVSDSVTGHLGDSNVNILERRACPRELRLRFERGVVRLVGRSGGVWWADGMGGGPGVWRNDTVIGLMILTFKKFNGSQ